MTTTKTIVITGANSGIGRATAEILAAKGYNIVTICRKKAEGEKTVAALLKINPELTLRISPPTFLTWTRLPRPLTR
jgi:NAD(P)-dependent dehydrogenase (short-subunit alcohol dehydrogenase family)